MDHFFNASTVPLTNSRFKSLSIYNFQNLITSLRQLKDLISVNPILVNPSFKIDDDKVKEMPKGASNLLH